MVSGDRKKGFGAIADRVTKKQVTMRPLWEQSVTDLPGFTGARRKREFGIDQREGQCGGMHVGLYVRGEL